MAKADSSLYPIGDTAHAFNLLAMIIFLVAVSTPAWVAQQLKVPVGAEQLEV